MHPSPEKRPSIETLTTLILSAGFGSTAVVSALLIIVASTSARQGDADRQAALFTALAVVVVLAIAWLITWALMQRLVIRRLQQDIAARARHMSEQQSAIVAQLREAAAQEERNRLARDLHDTIKQQLFSINVAAATAQSLRAHDPDSAAQHIQHVRDLSQAALAEMKALLTHLRPQPLATIGLIEAIREQLEALRFRAEVTTELHHDPLPDEERLPPGAQETIFRIVQEALSNTARHARARHARVTLTQEMAEGREWLRVRVEDDGQGFDPATAPSGMGLTNMRTRTESLGGRLEVHAKRGEGTIVECRVPLVKLQAREEQERRMKEEHFQQVYGASGLTSLAATALLIASILLVPALMRSQTGESGVWAYLAGASVVGAIVGVPLAFASLNWRRRALDGQPSDSIWNDVMYYYDTGAAFTLLTVVAWTAFSLRVFLLAAIALLGAIIVAAFHLRLHRRLEVRIREWATAPMLRARLREQFLFTGFTVAFVILVYTGLFGSVASVRLFHDTLDQAWLVSFLAIVYPFLTILGTLFAFLIHRHLRQLEMLEGTQPVAQPACDERLRQMRLTAAGLTLAYQLLCVAPGALAMNLPTGALAAAIAAIAVLTVKWRVEHRLTERIDAWSSLQEQQSALSLYGLLLAVIIFGILGGIVGALIGRSESASLSEAAAPTAAIWVIAGFGTWWLGMLFYLGMQTIVSRRRVRALRGIATRNE